MQNPENQAAQMSTMPIAEPQRPPKRKLKKVLLIIGGILLLVILFIGWSSLKISREAPIAQEMVTSFMRYVSINDFDSAYKLTSQEFQREVSRVDFEQKAPARKPLYANFESQELLGLHIQKNVGMPTEYTYSGAVKYSDGDIGQVSALLVKEDNEFKIADIRVEVAPERFQKFLQPASEQ